MIPCEPIEIVGRLGKAPRERDRTCGLKTTCPDILVLSNGDFAVIGKDITDQSQGLLPADAGCGEDERVILLPRSVLVAARRDIPLA